MANDPLSRAVGFLLNALFTIAVVWFGIAFLLVGILWADTIFVIIGVALILPLVIGAILRVASKLAGL